MKEVVATHGGWVSEPEMGQDVLMALKPRVVPIPPQLPGWAQWARFTYTPVPLGSRVRVSTVSTKLPSIGW